MNPAPYPSLFKRLISNVKIATCEWADHEAVAGRGPCWQWQLRQTRRGYGRCARRVPGRPHPVPFAAHRCMAEIVLGRTPTPAETVDHACAIPWCINPYHLRLMSAGDNTSDARRRALGYERRSYPWLIAELPAEAEAA